LLMGDVSVNLEYVFWRLLFFVFFIS